MLIVDCCRVKMLMVRRSFLVRAGGFIMYPADEMFVTNHTPSPTRLMINPDSSAKALTTRAGAGGSCVGP